MTKRIFFSSLFLLLFAAGCSQPNMYKDSDHDGVYDFQDVCANTPKFVIVDKFGCPKDSDNDGVMDLYDKCPNTPLLDIVNSNGCCIKK